MTSSNGRRWSPTSFFFGGPATGNNNAGSASETQFVTLQDNFVCIARFKVRSASVSSFTATCKAREQPIMTRSSPFRSPSILASHA